MSDFCVITLQTITDSRGTITVMQDALPFEIKRTYWITGAEGQTRGGHRHHLNRQAMVAVTGSVCIELDDGKHRAHVELSHPSQCLIVEPEDWHTMTFGERATLAVFASHHFDADDYIDERPS